MFRLDARSAHGGVTVTGVEQIVQSTAGVWRATLSGIAANNAARVRAYRALVTALDGRFGTVLVPLHDKLRAPRAPASYTLIGDVIVNPLWETNWPTVDVPAYQWTSKIPQPLGSATVASDQSFTWTPSNGEVPAVGDYVTLYSERRRIQAINGVRHFFTPMISPVRTFGSASVTANATIAAGATTGVLNRATGAALEAGMYFSVAGKLYMIASVTGVAGNLFTVSFRPPARAQITAATAVEMISPTCEMRLASDDTGELALSHLDRYGTATLDFVEAVGS
jgi:hypothetical protein